MQPRHPSQLYQAALEASCCSSSCTWSARQPWIRERLGMMTGLFLIGYAIARSIGGLPRAGGESRRLQLLTWGQILGLPMFLFGAYW
jgi:phosphatidylglycerol:prolipoprotein diacylglycerol transferase